MAEALFHARGYSDVGVAELSSTIGVAPPSLYAAFGSKAELFAAVVDRYAERQGGWAGEALAKAADTADGVRRLFAAAVDAYTRYPVPGCLVMEGVRGGDATCVARKDALLQLLTDWMASEAPDRAERLAEAALVALTGLSASAREGVDRASLTEFADLAADGLIVRLTG